ncbi:hypothetical protein RoseRS_2938 [Roseiflexus sp. RS-1]|jgi:hypothetical protein|nr:hypothetical protein RoseRS_2938 [Roseiflexus sp. RS-1]
MAETRDGTQGLAKKSTPVSDGTRQPAQAGLVLEAGIERGSARMRRMGADVFDPHSCPSVPSVPIRDVFWHTVKRQPVDRRDRAHQVERPIWSTLNAARKLAEDRQA